MKWHDNYVVVEPPKRPKKITGTRFAAIQGLNKWSTPFKAWCEITRTYEEPFEDTLYTKAGKVIEPKQAEYMKKSYFMTDLKTPTDIYGADYFKTTRGDFFHEHLILGGMWDYLLTDETGKPTVVLEMKTTKRSEDWQYDIPEYYALQAALYAYLLGVDEVYMVVSFLTDKDYDKPEEFVPTFENTAVMAFRMSERYPHFNLLVDETYKWWERHVEEGISPHFDEKKDADILKVLRTNTLSPDTNIEEVIKEAELLKAHIEYVTSTIADAEKRLKVLTDIIKEYGISHFREGDNTVTIAGGQYKWNLSKSTTSKIDKERLEEDGLLAKYTKNEISYRLGVAVIKEAKQ